MRSTHNPVCPLCGLQYASRPLLELHFREDHPPRNRPPGHITNGMITMTAAPPPGQAGSPGQPRSPSQPRSGWTRTALRRAIGRLKSLNDEFVRGQEAMFRSMRAPQTGTRPEAPASKDTPAA
jgi:hypothetical protein